MFVFAGKRVETQDEENPRDALPVESFYLRSVVFGLPARTRRHASLASPGQTRETTACDPPAPDRIPVGASYRTFRKEAAPATRYIYSADTIPP